MWNFGKIPERIAQTVLIALNSSLTVAQVGYEGNE